MELVARRSKLPYGGKTYNEGDRFTAEDRHGKLLILIGAAEQATEATPGYLRADLEPQVASGAEVNTGEYARRDMQPAPVKRKRGRPRKVKPNGDA